MNESGIDNQHKKFDFLFVGLGAANCLLILRLHEKGLILDKKIAIVEPKSKSTNDRTFCFWSDEDECSKLNLKTLVSYSWDHIKISGIDKQQIQPLHYFHIRGIDLYNETKRILRDCDVAFYTSILKENPEINLNHYTIKCGNETFSAIKVFDSRPPSFLKPSKQQSHLLQSFYGWKIKTASKTFDTSTMVMMDFNVPQNNSTQFIYILPFTDDTALIELTRFGSEKVGQDEAQYILQHYLEAQGVSFDLLEEEEGVIPMSSANMKTDDFGENWINMGARANMLKSTTGYAFHAMAEDAMVQAEAIQNDQLPKRKSRKDRFAYYDRLLLKLLDEKPENGKMIFETLFKKVPVNMVLTFLREKTILSEEILIFSRLPKKLFIHAAIKDVLLRISSFPVLIWPFLFTLLTLILSIHNLEYVSWGLLAGGFLSVGLSHGALDHLTSRKINNKKELLYFALRYLFKSAVLGLVWLLIPDLALLIFIAYSAWHFGQADFKEWHLKQGWQTFLWGFTVLMAILFFHFEELDWILQQIPNLNSVQLLQKITDTQLVSFQVLIIACGLFLAAVNKSKQIFFTLAYLLLSSGLPLLVAFGIYFIGQHSIHGWRHLLKGLNESSSSLWLKSLPFSIGGACIILYFLLSAGLNYTGMFFIILSCLSVPHVFSMHRFYSRIKSD